MGHFRLVPELQSGANIKQRADLRLHGQFERRVQPLFPEEHSIQDDALGEVSPFEIDHHRIHLLHSFPPIVT